MPQPTSACGFLDVLLTLAVQGRRPARALAPVGADHWRPGFGCLRATYHLGRDDQHQGGTDLPGSGSATDHLEE